MWVTIGIDKSTKNIYELASSIISKEDCEKELQMLILMLAETARKNFKENWISKTFDTKNDEGFVFDYLTFCTFHGVEEKIAEKRMIEIISELRLIYRSKK